MPQTESRSHDSLWRLIEAHSKQLGDSVTAARIPFLLALTWAFIWAWALYAYEFSYVDVLHASTHYR
jgi:hypothetical protein